ncbi:methyltransferase [Chloroflexota bacterium]
MRTAIALALRGEFQEESVLLLDESANTKIPTPTPAKQPAPPKVDATARAARFRELADNLQKQIDTKRNTSLKQMNPTRRRMNMIASMEQDARRLEVLQDKLRALANAWETDTVPQSLRELTAKNQVEYLLRYSNPPVWGKRDKADFKRLQRAGLVGATAYSRARADLDRLGDPAAGQERPEDKIAALEREVRTYKIPGYFPTPPDVVERLLALANILPGERVLEPSAGNGSIADAIRDAHPDATLDVCEVSADLREILELKEHNLVAWDCLELAGATYDTILMNPPFENFQDIEHVRHAFSLLKPGGRVVAIMGEGVFFRRGRKPEDFRVWLDEVGWEAEQLPGGTFKTSGTGVASRIVVLDKPAARVAPVPEVKPEPVSIPATFEPAIAQTPVAPVAPVPEKPEPVIASVTFEPAMLEPVAPTPAQMEMFTARAVLQFGLQKRRLMDVEASHNN